MKLFLKDHLGFILIYLLSFIILPVFIDKLDGFKNHYLYFCFLVIVLFTAFLIVRYFRSRKMYIHLEKNNISVENINIHSPNSALERAYAAHLRKVLTLVLDEEDKYANFLDEQETLVSISVHQMKIPVSVIQLLVQSNQIESRDTLEWEKINRECHKLVFLLDQLLSYSRSTKLLSDLKIEQMSLRKTIVEVVNELKNYFIENEIFPEIDVPENITLYSDKKWIKVVIYQLLSNAIKYSDPNQRVSIVYNKGNIMIINQGDTIPDNEIGRVFDLFYTGTQGRKSGESTGIGLYLVKRILTTLDHPFRLSSIDYQTTFSIDFSESIDR